jgi:hypothetical protein
VCVGVFLLLSLLGVREGFVASTQVLGLGLCACMCVCTCEIYICVHTHADRYAHTLTFVFFLLLRYVAEEKLRLKSHAKLVDRSQLTSSQALKLCVASWRLLRSRVQG